MTRTGPWREVQIRGHAMNTPSASAAASRPAPYGTYFAPVHSIVELESADPYAQLEQRVRRRRVDGRIEAARAALAERRFDDAAAALDELTELDPGLPVLGELSAELDRQRHPAATGHRGPWIAAAAACALSLALFALLMSSSPRFGPLASRPLGGSALIVTPTPPASAVVEPSTVVEPRPRRSEPTPEPLSRVQEQTEAAAITSPAARASASIPTDDEALIRQTVRRYQDAYRTDSLQPQLLVFDTCQIEVLGSSAMAICRGAARDMPKAGSHEPRSERRVWSFTLNKHESDWTIETARTDQ
jgi:hypothetical protein